MTLSKINILYLGLVMVSGLVSCKRSEAGSETPDKGSAPMEPPAIKRNWMKVLMPIPAQR